MTTHDLVLDACAFRPPARIPRFDGFWQFPDSWRERLGPVEGLTDIAIWVPEEGAFPTRKRTLKEENGWIYEVNAWGQTTRRRSGAYFVETLDVAIPVGTDPDSVAFDPPDLDSRYLRGHPDFAAAARSLEASKRRHCVFGKTGGPYLRTTFVRGETQFLMDIAADPPLARALADKMGEHLAAVGVEQIRRWGLKDTGVWIYDDMAYNDGPMFGPESFEQVFLPAYRRMVKAYKDAGATYVILHSDGNIRPVLDMLVDAGIDGLNPLERRANMNLADVRRQYPNLILTGGMCNSDTLINGPAERVAAEAREIIDLGRDGGVVIGTHSISPEVPLDLFAVYHDTCLTYGAFTS